MIRFVVLLGLELEAKHVVGEEEREVRSSLEARLKGTRSRESIRSPQPLGRLLFEPSHAEYRHTTQLTYLRVHLGLVLILGELQ